MSFDLQLKNGDLVIGDNGDLATVQDSDKLIQDVLKALMTPLGSNKFLKQYGSLFTKSLVGNILDDEFTSTMAVGQLSNTIAILQDLQSSQGKIQHLSPSERIAAVKKIFVDRDAADPRYYNIIIEVLSGGLSVVPISLKYKPGL